MRLLGLIFLALASSVAAQFGFFDQMFGGGGGQQHHGHHHRQAQNVPSDSSVYRAQYARSHCDKYLCPDTLGLHFPASCYISLLGPWANANVQLAYTTRIIAPALGHRTRISLNLPRGNGYASPRVDSRLAKQQGRLSWPARDCYEKPRCVGCRPSLSLPLLLPPPSTPPLVTLQDMNKSERLRKLDTIHGDV